MKNLNLFWNQLFNSNDVNNHISTPSPTTTTTRRHSLSTESITQNNSFIQKINATKIIEDNKKKFVSKLLKLNLTKKISESRRRHSDSSVSVSDDDDEISLDSISSCSALSFILYKHNENNNDHQKQNHYHSRYMPSLGFNQMTLERRAISCFQIDNNNNNSNPIIGNSCNSGFGDNNLNKKYLWPLFPTLNDNNCVNIVSSTTSQINKTKTTIASSDPSIHQSPSVSSSTTNTDTTKCFKSPLLSSNYKPSKRIEIIREEDESDTEEEKETLNKMFDNSNKSTNPSISVPLRPLRNKKTERIEPFQKPDDLKSFWQQPKETITETNQYCASSSASADSSNDRRKSLDNNKQSSSSSSSSSGVNGKDGRNSSASNFLRTNNLRSSCPPPSRRRKSTDNINQSSRMIRSPSQHANHVINDNNKNVPNRNSFGLVDAIHTKINSAVRKSWLSSLFNSFNANNNNNSHNSNSNGNNSKEKRSKWKKSDDFQAEFFDRQSDLITESLLNRRSPLNFNIDSNSFKERKRQQMAFPSVLEPQSRPTSVFNNPQSKNHSILSQHQNWIESALHEPPPPVAPTKSSNIPSFIRPNSASAQVLAGLNRPRPRSACLDNTYMLRMRNGNFIEYTLDSDSKDESCSIISSHQHLATTTNSSTTNSNQQHQHGSSQDLLINHRNTNLNYSEQFLSHGKNGYDHRHQQSTQTKIPEKNDNHNLLRTNVDDFYKKQSSPINSYLNNKNNNNKSLIKPTTTSSSFSRPTTVTSTTLVTTTTTSTTTGGSSSSPSSSLITNHHNQQQQYSYSTKTSFTSTTSSSLNEIMQINQMDDHSLLVNIYWPFKNCTEVQIQPEHTVNDVIKQMLSSQIYAQGSNNNFNLSQRNSAKNHPISPNLPLPHNCTQWAYALRLICRKLNPSDVLWLHPTKNMHEFIDQNQLLFEKGWKLELRIRYIPFNLEELYRTNYLSFKFLYEQVLEEFLSLELTSTQLLSNQDLIIELGCYEIFRTHPYLTPQGLEKNSNWEVLENDLHRIFPISFINSIKSKQLRKLIKAKYKKIYVMGQEQVVFNFLKFIKQLVRFHRDVFQCSLGESIWSVPVELIIGPDVGIAYFTSTSTPAVTIVKSFEQVEQINIVSYSTMNKTNHDSDEQPSSWTNGNQCSKKILLNLRIRNEEDLLTISCPTFSMAQSIADLIDGYHRLATNCSDSIWINMLNLDNTNNNTNDNPQKSDSVERCSAKSSSSLIIEPKRAQFDLISNQKPSIFDPILNFESNSSKNNHKKQEISPDDGDYSNPVETCLEINRDNLKIQEIIGTGQFGDVHKGLFIKKCSNGSKEEEIPVAIKISRVQSDSTLFGRNDIHLTDQKLLSEAERMHKLDHHNIIKLIGVCSSSPVYVAMELAEYGELRSFLSKHGSQLEQRRLIEYSYQIASAMAYLESKQFVHRDIAARNVLVFSFDCIKLADFGLSRYIEDASYYMATNSKLPIKWMAPESINFRRFTTASDVWMFGVCVWEIFMLGKKPFPGVKNSDVIGLIECGDRLSKPSRCPEQLYELLLKCWRYEPDRRPTFRVIKRKIYDVYQNELGLIGAIARADIINDLSSSKSSLSSISAGQGDQSSSTSSSLSRMHLNRAPTAKVNRSSMIDPQKNNLSQSESNLSLNTSQSGVLDPAKIKEILDEQRRQMKEDQRWLQQNEFKWQSTNSSTISQSDSLPKDFVSSDQQNESERESSIYEDANCDNKNLDICIQPPSPSSISKFNHNAQQNLYSVPNLQAKSRGGNGDESYNSSFKSTKSSLEPNNNDNNNMDDTPTTSGSSSNSSSMDSATHSKKINNDSTGLLSVSLQKFFKHNKLTNAKVRQEMMEKVNCSSADVDRKDDPVYWSSINVVNSVRHLLKGVQELNTTEYIDLVKNVGLELRNLLSNVDIFMETIPDDYHRNLIIGQKKLSTDMNDLVESMKKTITYSETPMQGAYKQNMLEASYILVIDSKNLMDTVDEIRLQIKNKSL